MNVATADLATRVARAQSLLKELGVAQRSIVARGNSEDTQKTPGHGVGCGGAGGGGGGGVSRNGAGEERGGGGNDMMPDVSTLDFGEGEIEWLDGDWSPPPRGQGASTGLGGVVEGSGGGGGWRLHPA